MISKLLNSTGCKYQKNLFRSWYVSLAGGAVAETVYHRSEISFYLETLTRRVSFEPTTSQTAKCNIMGYYETSNNVVGVSDLQKTIDTLICTDSCSVYNECGFDSSIKNRSTDLRSTPIVHVGVIDSPFRDEDYLYYPDLQMVPTMCFGVVPVYNLPELASQNLELVLSRQVLADIYLGKVTKFTTDWRIYRADPIREYCELEWPADFSGEFCGGSNGAQFSHSSNLCSDAVQTVRCVVRLHGGSGVVQSCCADWLHWLRQVLRRVGGTRQRDPVMVWEIYGRDSDSHCGRVQPVVECRW